MYFDNGYTRAAEAYERYLASGDECTPKVVHKFINEDGMHDGEMNCENCDNKECEYWEQYN